MAARAAQCAQLIGRERFVDAVRRLLGVLEHPELTRHLFFNVIEAFFRALAPELDAADGGHASPWTLFHK